MLDSGLTTRRRAATDPLSEPAATVPRLSVGRFFCHACDREVQVIQHEDDELECAVCKATCVERLEEQAAGTSFPFMDLSEAFSEDPPPPPPPNRAPRVTLLLAPRRTPDRWRQAVRHVGIRCDGCNSRDFAGVRYRCLRCPDFDFCANCHSQRSSLHPGHEFETIVTPRGVLTPLLTEFLARSPAGRTSIAIIGIGMASGHSLEVNSGLTDPYLAWWLADYRRLVSIDQMAAQDPGWSCPICAEGLEAERENGWVVQICGPQAVDDADEVCCSPALVRSSSSGGTATASLPASAPVSALDAGEAARPEAYEGSLDLHSQRHVYHEGCLRKWLLKRNSCPVCRRSPVVPQA